MRRAIFSVLLTFASLACGATQTREPAEASQAAETREPAREDAPPPSDDEPPPSDDEREPPRAESPSDAVATVASAPDAGAASPEPPLSTLVDAVYVGRTETVMTRRQVDPSDLCASDLTRVDAASGGEPARLCTPLRQVARGVTQGFPTSAPSAFIATRRAHGRERIVAAVTRDASCDATPCAIPERELRMQLECNEAAEIWENIAPDDLRCRDDADCELLGDRCWASAFNHAAAPRYRAHWPCPSMEGGACVPREFVAACDHHRCEARER